MGYSYRNSGYIKDFWPDDAENIMYICSDISPSIQDLIDLAKEKWPDADFGQIEIGAEHIHTNCLTYDLHDPSDYTNFITLSIRS